MNHDVAFPPHGVCWLWDPLMVAVHALGDLGTAFYYMLIPAIALYIYRSGRLRRLKAAYPALWRRGAAFVLICGVSHIGATLEIWVGGWLYYATGAVKLLMLTASALFAREFWRRRSDLVIIGRLLERAQEQEDRA